MIWPPPTYDPLGVELITIPNSEIPHGFKSFQRLVTAWDFEVEVSSPDADLRKPCSDQAGC